MPLEQLEEKMGIEFPKGFHKIYETGAMDWLTVTPIPFEDISMWNGELEELLHKWEENEEPMVIQIWHDTYSAAVESLIDSIQMKYGKNPQGENRTSAQAEKANRKVHPDQEERQKKNSSC